MAQHIGIVACSCEGAALCYRTICQEGEKYMGRLDHPEVTLHNHALGKYDAYFGEEVDWKGVAELMISSTEKLKSAGADFAICPDNTIHQSFDMVMEKSPLPWLHIAEEVAREAKRRGFKKLGLTGTKYLVSGPVYPSRLSPEGIDYVRPAIEEREQINTIIYEELVKGIVTDESREYFVNVIESFKSQGCDAVVLGCTEIPLIMNDEVSPLPTLDSTGILARAALRKAVG